MKWGGPQGTAWCISILALVRASALAKSRGSLCRGGAAHFTGEVSEFEGDCRPLLAQGSGAFPTSPTAQLPLAFPWRPPGFIACSPGNRPGFLNRFFPRVLGFLTPSCFFSSAEEGRRDLAPFPKCLWEEAA